jgi:hypothetical protein
MKSNTCCSVFVCSSLVATSGKISFLTLNVNYEMAKNVLLGVLQHVVNNVRTTRDNGMVYSKLEQCVLLFINLLIIVKTQLS